MISIIILAIAGLCSLFIGAYKLKRVALPLVLVFSGAAWLANMAGWNASEDPMISGMLRFDSFASNYTSVLIILSMLVLILSRRYYGDEAEHLGDIYGIFLFGLVGGLIMVSYHNLIAFFIGIEILSIPLYILAASERNNLLSNEAGLKYFLQGSFATAFLLLGITLVYGMTGSFQVEEISAYVQRNQGSLPSLFQLGILLVIVAFMFKTSSFPFHFWAPDVYQGSPAVIMAFMSTVGKAAAFGGFIRFLFYDVHPQLEIWAPFIWVIALLTMTVGNLMALHQTSFKRLLAYSAIANSGYILVAMESMELDTSNYILYYLLVYAVANILALSVYLTIQENTGEESLEGIKGLYRTNPILTFCLAVSMLSLAGIPPLAGFFGKYFLFGEAIRNGEVILVLFALLNSVIGAYYYLRILVLAFHPEESQTRIRQNLSYNLVLAGCVLILIFLGCFPSLFFDRFLQL